MEALQYQVAYNIFSIIYISDTGDNYVPHKNGRGCIEETHIYEKGKRENVDSRRKIT